MPAHTDAESLKKSHNIVTLQFSEVVKDHAKDTLMKDANTINL